VSIAWNANTEPDLTGYVVRYGTAPGAYTVAIDVGNRTEFALTLDEFTTYYVAVEAYNAHGHSPTSSELTIPADYSGCVFSLNSPSVAVGGAATSVTVGLTAQSQCPWRVSSFASWITVSGRTALTGSGSVSLAIAANTSAMKRVGTVAIGGRALLVTQGAAAEPRPPLPPAPLPSPATLQTAAEADFNGDLKADLLWRRSDGAVALWKMNGLKAVEQVWITPSIVDPAWKIVGTGDLDGNGRPEILWQHTTGELRAWSMNGTALQASAYLNPRRVDPAWRVAAVADMNGDSKADLIWQDSNGLLVVWYMRGVEMTSSAYLTPNSAGDRSWKIVGAGDLNGDGKPDLVWQHDVSGELVAWFMSGISMTTWRSLSPRTAYGTGWTVGAVVDLNGDGKSDLVWQHTSGTVATWLMNGTTAAAMSPLSPATVATDWHLAAPK
jgi:hypothetical protein